MNYGYITEKKQGAKKQIGKSDSDLKWVPTTSYVCGILRLWSLITAPFIAATRGLHHFLTNQEHFHYLYDVES